MKWFNLSRYAAKLTVLPKSDARTRTVLRLEMPHSRDWAAQRAIAQVLDPTVAERYTPDRFREALADLGFSAMDSTRLASGTAADFNAHGSEYPTFAAEALRDSIKLSDLQRLFPGLTVNDVEDMPLERVLVASEDFQGYEARWERLRRAMVNDSIGVWVPNQQPWGQSDKPVPLREALETAGLLGKDRDRTIAIALALKASQLGYRDDALAVYYVSEEAAQADGLKEGQYHRSGFAASVPLAVVGQGKVVALRDVWAMPDLRRTISPENALWLRQDKVPQSLVVDYLRERMAYATSLKTALDRLDSWIADPKQLKNESSDLVWGQVAVFNEGYALVERHSSLADSVFGETELALERNDGRNWRLRKLNNIDNSAYEALALSAEKLGIASKDKVLDTLLGARLLWQKMVNAEIAAERDAAMAAAKAVQAKPVQQPLVVDVPDTRKHVDVGEKIGGARKDYAKRAMALDDVLAMNDLEIKLHVNKQNVWPPLNYAAMKEAGVEPKVAMTLKLFKDSINTAPVKYSPLSDRECADNFVTAVGRMRDFFEGVKTEAEFRSAAVAAVEYLSQGEERLIYGGSLWHQVGRDTSKFLQRDFFYAAEKKIQKATRSWNAATQRIEYAEPWTALVKPAKTATEEEAAERKRRTEIDKELHVPHLEHLQRNGEDWRDGRDVTADELLERFGFRAIEYGEWLPQKERQAVINTAFDSFADLAQALNLRPQDLSMGGKLAVAFGARGTGGRGAALAHYEPGRTVINLTRLKGGGSLAHEMGHFLDHQIAALSGGGTYASEMTSPPLDSMRVLATRLSWRNATVEELTELASRNAARSKSNAESWLGSVPVEQRPEALADLGHAMDSMRMEITRRVEALLPDTLANNPYRGVLGEAGVISFSVLHSLADEVRDEMSTKWRGKLGKDGFKHMRDNCWHMGKALGLGSTLQAYAERGLPVPEVLLGQSSLRKQSVFSRDAEKLDNLRSAPYWNTTRELFARAFAAYVQDKIEELGGRSDYLVHGAGDGRKVADIEASPNPSGEDREALRACFDNLLDEYRATLTNEATQDMTP